MLRPIMTINIHLNNAFHSIIVGAIHELPYRRIKNREKLPLFHLIHPKFDEHLIINT